VSPPLPYKNRGPNSGQKPERSGRDVAFTMLSTGCCLPRLAGLLAKVEHPTVLARIATVLLEHEQGAAKPRSGR
jgi:hypothetical protein